MAQTLPSSQESFQREPARFSTVLPLLKSVYEAPPSFLEPTAKGTGVPKMANNLPKERVQQILELAKQGHSGREIASRLHVSRGAVARRLGASIPTDHFAGGPFSNSSESGEAKPSHSSKQSIKEGQKAKEATREDVFMTPYSGESSTINCDWSWTFE